MAHTTDDHARLARVVPPIAGAIATALLAAGCGGGSPTAPSRPSGAHRPGAQAIAFADCMRAHGVPSFPDPHITVSGNSVGVSQSIPAGLVASPAFRGAQQACIKLAPQAQPQHASVTPGEQAQLVRFAGCVRSHGVPSFPDPSQGGAFNVPPALNTQSPQFQAAVQKCRGSGLDLSISQSGPGGP